jgi:putative ABC transport system permease protein
MALLKVANVKKSYYITKTLKQEVLKGINVEFKSGDLVALLGESGCGKSTLINILGGLDEDYTGSVVIKDEFIRDFNEKQMDDYRKKRVGLIFQNYNLIPHLTIKENVEIAMTISDINEKVSSDRAIDLLKMMGLDNFASKYPSQLSGGQKQRVAIARALANNPTIILADEPTGSLDPESAELIMKILKKIAESGKLVIIVTHSEKVANECGRILKMEDGKIVSDKQINKLHIDSKRDKEIVPKSIKTKEVMKLSYKNVKKNKSRSLLVSIGMAIGMAAVMLILCLSSGLTGYVNSVYAQNLQSLQIVATSSSTIKSTTIDDINNLSGIKSITQSYTTSGTATFDDNSLAITNINIYLDNFYPSMIYGEFNNDDEHIIVNETFANNYKSKLGIESLIECVGKSISVSKNSSKTLIISGIYDDVYSNSDKNNVYITENTMKTLVNTTSLSTNVVYVTASDVSYVTALKSDLQKMGFTVDSEENQASSVLNYIDIGTKVLIAISIISLVVSALMIFIILYISVTERTKEIGILRAIGSRKKDIRLMFMFEAGIIGLIGGVLSVAICFAISLITNLICLGTIHYMLISFNVLYYILGIIISIVIAVLAGIAPSYEASELDPVDSLRAE